MTMYIIILRLSAHPPHKVFVPCISIEQGAFNEAVKWLEKAIQLTPTDAIISEHLGDAYWQTGRQAEASFKWQNALNMGIEQARVPALQDKLANGL